MANQRNQAQETAASQEDQATLQALSNKVANSSSDFASFTLFAQHLTLALELLQEWQRMERRVDHLTRQEVDLRAEITRLQDRKSRLEADVYAR